MRSKDGNNPPPLIETLDLTFPRPVESLHQIELTSKCSLRCLYCPSPSIVAGKYPDRRAMDMPIEVLVRALAHLKFYTTRGTQGGEVNLAGIGESMMREDFVECVELVRAAVPSLPIVLATNGLHLTDAIASSLERIGGVRLWVSLHRPEKAGRAVEVARQHGLLDGVSADPSVNADDWAGQVDWHRSYVSPIACNWIRKGWVMVMSDGRVTACCLDAQGIGVVGHVDDAVGSLKTKPYGLCVGCQQVIAVEGVEQRSAKEL